jgi:organic hydroperoxide reductase OsmC/OhrA
VSLTCTVECASAGEVEGVAGALNHVIRQEKVKTGETSVTAKVSNGSIENGALELAVELAVNISDVSIGEAQQLTERAQQVCPY